LHSVDASQPSTATGSLPQLECRGRISRFLLPGTAQIAFAPDDNLGLDRLIDFAGWSRFQNVVSNIPQNVVRIFVDRLREATSYFRSN